jgi:hypothetical protein
MNRHLTTPGLAKLAAWPACRAAATCLENKLSRQNRPRLGPPARRPLDPPPPKDQSPRPVPWLIGRCRRKDWKKSLPRKHLRRADSNCEFSLSEECRRIDCMMPLAPLALSRTWKTNAAVWMRLVDHHVGFDFEPHLMVTGVGLVRKIF